MAYVARMFQPNCFISHLVHIYAPRATVKYCAHNAVLRTEQHPCSWTRSRLATPANATVPKTTARARQDAPHGTVPTTGVEAANAKAPTAAAETELTVLHQAATALQHRGPKRRPATLGQLISGAARK
eukprot:353459-Chlamydomonas_euryale.AAC.5